MREVVSFKSLDGCVWESRTQAENRDSEIRTCSDLDGILSKKQPLGFRGWMQHNLHEVYRLRESVLEIAKKLHPSYGWDQYSASDLVHPGSFMSRLVSDSDGPFSKIWYRACCIDDRGREWEQWFFRNNPEKGLEKWPEPTFK